MRSMTGYGRGESVIDGAILTVEVTSVNKKQLEINIYLPRELEIFEPLAREMLSKKISRGKLNVRALIEWNEGIPLYGRVNKLVAKAYTEEFKQLIKELGLFDELKIDTLVKMPGVISSCPNNKEVKKLKQGFICALNAALDEMISMRVREGKQLVKDISTRLKQIIKATDIISKRAPMVLDRYKKQLLERIRNAGVSDFSLNDSRLAQEIVLFSDRSDITEELIRLKSHFSQMQSSLASDLPVGRQLEFILQEINREVNTIGSKASDSLISKQVIFIKTELEKIREQVQNIE